MNDALDDIDRLAIRLEELNRAYRSGRPLVSDAEYDGLVERLRTLDPGHRFLQAVEPETFAGRKQIRHPVPMLSTEKAYTAEQLERFVQRVNKDAEQLGLTPVNYQVTPKLDGLAGRDDGRVFVSRGNGLVGFEISNAFDKGIVPVGGRGLGLGEIVVVKSYFDRYLADKFVHPRNMVVGIVSSDVLNVNVREALEKGMVRFVPYARLPAQVVDGPALLRRIAAISDELLSAQDYPTDGVVVEVTDERLKHRMGATAHHYRWQIAVKRKGETARTTVAGIQWQVGRTGNITPVLEVEPITLSGATIRRVTAHHAGMLAKLGIGIGADIEVIRSGEVIPKLEQVIHPAVQAELPRNCPVCAEALIWEGDFLKCINSLCAAQTRRRIGHWFRILGNADWFGEKTVENLVSGGYDSLEKIYAMSVQDFLDLGFGPVQSKNLSEALDISRSVAVEDWRYLAALGIPHLGVGDSRKLLEQIELERLWTISRSDIEAIKGFGEEKSGGIVKGLAAVEATHLHLQALGFNLIRTEKPSASDSDRHPLTGKHVVFTGAMQHGTREALQAEARRLGAVVQTSVSGHTDWLICGEKVGRTKLEKAERAGVKVFSEQEYYALIRQGHITE